MPIADNIFRGHHIFGVSLWLALNNYKLSTCIYLLTDKVHSDPRFNFKQSNLYNWWYRNIWGSTFTHLRQVKQSLIYRRTTSKIMIITNLELTRLWDGYGNLQQSWRQIGENVKSPKLHHEVNTWVTNSKAYGIISNQRVWVSKWTVNTMSVSFHGSWVIYQCLFLPHGRKPIYFEVEEGVGWTWHRPSNAERASWMSELNNFTFRYMHSTLLTSTNSPWNST